MGIGLGRRNNVSRNHYSFVDHPIQKQDDAIGRGLIFPNFINDIDRPLLDSNLLGRVGK